MRVVGALAAAAALAMFATPTFAGTITRLYTFDFSGFTPLIPGPAAPDDPVTGTFIVTFDPTVAVSDQTTGLKVSSFSLPITGKFAFSFTPFGMMSLGAITGPGDHVAQLTFGTDDFFLGFFTPLATPQAPSAVYSQAGFNEAWTTSTATVTARDGAPEPGTWALMVAGVGILGSALRRRRYAV